MADNISNTVLQPSDTPNVMSPDIVRDDRILSETRWIGACIPLFLFVAFIMLYFFPNDTATLFAWTITPTMTPLMMGGGYIAGSYFFVRLVMGGKWHWYTNGFPAIATFTWFMLISTLLHLDKFHQGHISFYAWFGLYIITPFLVPFLWLRNRRTDPGTPDPSDVVVPSTLRMVAGITGVGLFLIALFMLIFPDTAISIWPWKLTQLTAQVIGGWFALPAVVGIMLSRDSRWSAWPVLLESQMLALVLILVSVVRAWSDFNQSNVLTWVFIVGISLLLVGVLTLYITMESRRRRIVTP
ncbi:MAG TPA: hypothetical protein VLQ48_01365 [Chloroflexia bacterium]|nr:hypothetical protein [Chloroflexia bacterium]